MIDIAKKLFQSEKIQRVGIISVNDCDVLNRRLMPQWAKSVIVFCIPYRTTREIGTDGISEYARIKDYHKVVREIYDRILPILIEKSGHQCMGFCDHSPINEKLAALKCGLGILGRNSLFIDKVYGSFVFLGSIVTDAPYNEKVTDIISCENCGKCISVCPAGAIIEKGIDPCLCLSGVSQKKQKTDYERAILKKNGISWGCDICQLACPHNECASLSPLKAFADSRVSNITHDYINNMCDEEFRSFAFSFRGKKTVLDNLRYNAGATEKL